MLYDKIRSGLGRRWHAWRRRRRVDGALRTGRPPVVKVYGLLRTGTNYLTRLVEQNFDAVCVSSTEIEWKHGPCSYDTRLRYIFIVKDPYSWVVSFMEWEKNHARFAGGGVSDFLSTGITHGTLREVWGCDDVVMAWNEALRSWRTLADKPNVVFVRYEDLLASFDRELGRIGDALNLGQRNSMFKDLDKRADDWKTPKPRRQLSRAYYQNGEYLKKFSSDDLQVMRAKLDPELVDAFGYKVL